MLSNSKMFSDDLLNLINDVHICLTDCTKDIVGKGENAAFQHFLLFQQCLKGSIFFFSNNALKKFLPQAAKSGLRVNELSKSGSV